MFFRFTNMDYCDAVSGDFNSGSGGVVFRQSDVFVYSVILILWSFGFGRSIGCVRLGIILVWTGV